MCDLDERISVSQVCCTQSGRASLARGRRVNAVRIYATAKCVWKETCESFSAQTHTRTHALSLHSTLVLPELSLVFSHGRRHKHECVPRSRVPGDVRRATTGWDCPAAVVTAINRTDQQESCRCRTKIRSIIGYSAFSMALFFFFLFFLAITPL